MAAYFDFVSSNHDRESGFSFLFFSFFLLNYSNLLEFSRPQIRIRRPFPVGNYICIRSPRGEDRELISF